MVEEIKKLAAELQVKPFGDSGVLQQSKIPIVYSRPVEKPAPGVALECPRRTDANAAGLKYWPAGFRGSVMLSGPTRFGVSTGRVMGPPKAVPSKRLIICFDQCYRQASRESRDAADGPSVRQSFRTA